MKKNNRLGSLILFIFIIVVAYVAFGVFIVNDGGSLNNLVQGSEDNYSMDGSAQARGFGLIKSNWNRVSKNHSLMQRQIDTKGN